MGLLDLQPPCEKTYIDRNFPRDFSLDMEPDNGWGIEFDGNTYVTFGPDEKNGEQIIFRRCFRGIEDHDRPVGAISKIPA